MMKRITIQINYTTSWGEMMFLTYSEARSGVENSMPMNYISGSLWEVNLDVSKELNQLYFNFFAKEGSQVIRQESGEQHSFILGTDNYTIRCAWQEEPKQRYFHSSIFTKTIFNHKRIDSSQIEHSGIQFIVSCIHVEDSEELVMSGGSNYLGKWEENNAISLLPIDFGKWLLQLDEKNVLEPTEYKFAIRDKATKKVIEWEDGDNRFLESVSEDSTQIVELQYKKDWIDWKGSGLSIPVFSLRSEKSFGIGEFTDLKLTIDWAANCSMRIIQLLPINDTTQTYTWHDSYPYNGITIYALHPIYLGLSEYPLLDKGELKRYTQEFSKLNKLKTIDYTSVIKLKTEYIKNLFEEIGESTLEEKGYKEFYKQNKDWLFSYASFCYLRDKYNTAQMSDWEEFSVYNKSKLDDYIKRDKEAQNEIDKTYFTQYLLHLQLSSAKEYAHEKGVTLKGDIPIGISPNSVEAWIEPHLFNLDCQTGAPPDAFSVHGQNWGFPTYNWSEMQKDNYSWWRKRFQKMADYFDSYRIDHILGFFRIWEIPETSVYGLLGYFNPALPLSIAEIKNWGYPFEEKKDTVATIHNDDVEILFGQYSENVKNKYLQALDADWFILGDEVDNQQKIKELFLGQDDEKSAIIREGLYAICDEVLFIKDKYDTSRYHPIISIEETKVFNRLSEFDKDILSRMSEDYFYHRHSIFWKEEALSKLPALISATDMLVCGEDLGMVPESVPSVMNDLQILSLEIERMPKQIGLRFSCLEELNYLSVVTTSTHDMSPIRLWWQEENRDVIQNYYNSRLNREGAAPKECNMSICTQIIQSHLKSPAMLAILPLQDWLSISDKLKRDNPAEEQINVPSDPQHNWNYRMHLSLEALVEDKSFSDTIKNLCREGGR